MDPETKGDAEREGKMGVKEREQVKRERRCMGATVTPPSLSPAWETCLSGGPWRLVAPLGADSSPRLPHKLCWSSLRP